VKLRPVAQVAVFYEPGEHRIKVGRLALKGRELLFEYDAAFLGSKLELSPIHLPLAPGVVVGRPDLFDGLPGVFDDSLPDGWGRLLLDRRAAELGIARGALTALDRLTVIGARSMGALTYEPEVAIDDPAIATLAALAKQTQRVLRGGGGADLERLIALGGSPQGARPKVLVELDGSAWLVKFRGAHDDRHTAPLEHAYFVMAKAAGIEVPRTRVLGQTKRTPGYFAIERFDRAPAQRIHMHTLGGLLHLPHGYPALDYTDLLKVTRRLTRNEAAVAEMFRRACFNVLAHNRDDHCRNFAFLMDARGAWRPSPAYDLTFSPGPGGQHTLLVAGEGQAPTHEHLLRLARSLELKRATRILDEVRAATRRFKTFADRAGVPAKVRATVASAIGV
jgi:serine/threonine-protein kinase HipA